MPFRRGRRAVTQVEQWRALKTQVHRRDQQQLEWARIAAQPAQREAPAHDRDADDHRRQRAQWRARQQANHAGRCQREQQHSADHEAGRDQARDDTRRREDERAGAMGMFPLHVVGRPASGPCGNPVR